MICLCGSSKFKDDFIRVGEDLTLQGNIVIGLSLYGHAEHKFDTVITPEIKTMLDDMHRQKIDMSDAIFVINKNGYIGNSTQREIAYARFHNKPIYYME